MSSAQPPRGRSRALALTRLGARRLSAAHDAVFAVEAVMLQGISTRDRRTVADVLLRCAENVEDA
jgi:DNA-binding MarR family transcriptional regulator